MALKYERKVDEACLYRKPPSWGKSFKEGL